MPDARFGRVLTAMVTPFDSQNRIHSAEAAALAKHLMDNGSDGIVVCGTTGESPTLAHAEKLDLIRIVCEAVGSQGPVIAGTGGNDTASSITLTRAAESLGADAALLVVPPYNRPSQEGLYQHFRSIAESVPNLPCVLYNVPGRTSQNLDAKTTLRLANDVPNIVATKEASGNLAQISEIAASAPAGFCIYSGDDALTLPMLAIGAIGVVSVTAHLVGKELSAMCRAFFAGGTEEAARLHYKMLPISNMLFMAGCPNPVPVKTALALAGHNVGGVRLPLVDANEQERSIISSSMAAYGLI